MPAFRGSSSVFVRTKLGVGRANLSRHTHYATDRETSMLLPLDKSIISYWCHATFQLNGNISWAGNEAYRCRKTDQRLLLDERKSHVSSFASSPFTLALLFVSVPRLTHVPRNSAVITVCTLNSRALV